MAEEERKIKRLRRRLVKQIGQKSRASEEVLDLESMLWMDDQCRLW